MCKAQPLGIHAHGTAALDSLRAAQPLEVHAALYVGSPAGCFAINGKLKVPAMSRLVRPLPEQTDAFAWDARLKQALKSAWGKDVKELQNVTVVWEVPEPAAVLDGHRG